MTNKKSKLKKFIIVCLLMTICLSLGLVTYFFAITAGTSLDQQKIELASASSFQIFDNQNNGINISDISGKNAYVIFDELKPHTIDAFVSVEDKRFFNHKGIDYIRILGAIKNNILNPDKKQGGSTITQQVIKNTQLSSEKTISRKLKEIKLAKQLEKQYSKQQILEMYLNSIYFGNGCYGIENASRYYFDKSSSDLSIAESALLASTINAPSVYDPVSNQEKTNQRKDLILSLMLKNNKISQTEFQESSQEIIKIEKANKSYKNQYYKGVIAEACKILKVTENQLRHKDVKLYTYYNPEIQAKLEELIVSQNYTADNQAKLGSIVLDNQTKAVVAFASNGSLDLLNTYRQPGSLIKPILVYAPAFESGKYSPSSFVLDEQTCFGAYCPENASQKYHGMVTVKDAIAKSLNIPAVKVFEDVGISQSKNFASSLGIKFDNQDNNLALSLGGFTKGTTLKQLCDAYMCFANNGQFCQSCFIEKIVDNNDQIKYQRQIFTRQAVKESVAFLINDCLAEVSKAGTAKRMNSLGFSVCAKTGTVGTKSGNTDAYNVAYTPEHTVCCWIGSNTISAPLAKNISGATYPTMFNMSVLQSIYNNKTVSTFSQPQSVVQVGLNEQALKEYSLEKDDSSSVFALFDSRFIPKETQRTKVDIEISINNFENSKPIICFDAKRDVTYQIFRQNNFSTELITEIKFVEDQVCFTDDSAQSGEIYEYFVVAKHKSIEKESNRIKLLCN